jgi:hypothetical protein
VWFQEASIEEFGVCDRRLRQTNGLRRVYESKKKDHGQEEQYDCSCNDNLCQGILREREQIKHGHVEIRENARKSSRRIEGPSSPGASRYTQPDITKPRPYIPKFGVLNVKRLIATRTILSELMLAPDVRVHLAAQTSLSNAIQEAQVLTTEVLQQNRRRVP